MKYDREWWNYPVNPVILVVRADPKPVQIITAASRQGAIAAADANRLVGADFLEAQRRVIGVRCKERILLVSLFLNIPRQRVVTLPELR